MNKIICIKCGIPKDPGEFYRNPSAKSGLSGICKECAGDYVQEYNKGKYIPGKPNYHKSRVVLNDNFLQEAF